MKIIRNNIIPFKGFRAINLFGILFVRKNARIDDIMVNHEKIHTGQIKEALYIFFYLWYGIEFIVHLIRFRNSNIAYRKISFEREAYAYQNNHEYLDKRKPYAFLKYLE
ncbi:MAG: hypothetical protein A2W86_11875 [Bacteroidetes bacterium GWD2_45_23]|nr:MAG: hypothetical protein A2W87_08140 [Bacteroidetes bacterium GWC2_46_850]OFX70140.1 MAG: hypothetical protein A2071_04650 [Bacteroidetes bacterium GWC1_47_7]OFX85519.1 MAG: hypothetical protein A2W86_11875 [Bacteroidetes bacterium GWD2_45_23]HAR38561.1 hypothetical protein [Porphyromonadaceae bacterium]HBB00745.1 hypothetical protein [Porphyromonadaceae bacterium]